MEIKFELDTEKVAKATVAIAASYVLKRVSEGTAVSYLFYLRAAQQRRSVLFSDEQKLLFKGGKKGFAKNSKLDFYELLTKPRMKAT
jgi:hypothetical protein